MKILVTRTKFVAKQRVGHPLQLRGEKERFMIDTSIIYSDKVTQNDVLHFDYQNGNKKYTKFDHTGGFTHIVTTYQFTSRNNSSGSTHVNKPSCRGHNLSVT